MTDHEAVLHDLLLECGVEGVTLWHIRALAECVRIKRISGWSIGDRANNRFISDVRGEDDVLAEAWAENGDRDALSARLSDAAKDTDEVVSASCNCAQCRAVRRMFSELPAQPATGRP